MSQLDDRPQNLLDTHDVVYQPAAGQVPVFRSDPPCEVVLLGVAGERIAVGFNTVVGAGTGTACDPGSLAGKAQFASAASSTGR